MITNPVKFEFMILRENAINQSIIINNKTIELSKSMKLVDHC